MRDQNIRIISARRATKREHKRYEEGIWISVWKSKKSYTEENQKFRTAISEQFGVKLRKREKTIEIEEEYALISLKIHLKVLIWAKEEAHKKGIDYQTVINEFLLEKIG